MPLLVGAEERSNGELRTTSYPDEVEAGREATSKGRTATQSGMRQMTSNASSMRDSGFICELIACVKGFTGGPIIVAQPRLAPLRRHVIDKGSHPVGSDRRSTRSVGGTISDEGRDMDWSTREQSITIRVPSVRA